MTAPINLAGLLELLGYGHGELFQFATKASDGPFAAGVALYDEQLESIPQDRDVWFGVNPVVDVDTGRPGAEHVTRLAALWADLDVKDRGCPDYATAHTIIDDLSGMLGARPVAITYSGHGLQPLWAVYPDSTDAHIDNDLGPSLQRSDARALLRRWGRLVANVAETRGAGIDSVFDLPRILRCPGSINHKGDPVPVVCLSDTGAPIDVDRILDTLDEYGIPDLPDDHADPGAIVSAPSEWTYADVGCQYAPKVAQGWLTDNPQDRHPWLVGQATRIAAMHRNGCLTERQRDITAHYLTSRFQQLLSRGGQERTPGPGEIADAFAWGQQRAAAMSDRQLAEELGKHQHRQLLEAPNAAMGTGTTDRALRELPARVAPDGTGRGDDDRGADPAGGADPNGNAVEPSNGRGPAGLADVDAEPVEPRPVSLRDLLAAAGGPRDATTAGQDGPGPDRAPLAGLSAAPVQPAERTPFELAVEQAALNLWVTDEAKAIERRRKAGTVDVADQYLDATELDQLPKPDPLIDGVLNRHSLAILRGRDGTYKTFIALDWALSLATGKPWQGVHTETVKVLYVAGEGAYGIADRVAAWQHAWNTKLEPGQFTLRKSAVNLFVGGPLLDELIDRIIAGGYGLVVIDTLRRASGGADGNSTDMGVVIDNLARIKDATVHGSVLTLTHTDKGDNDTRGWSGIEDDTDIVWHVKRDEEEGAGLELANTKMKDGPDGHKYQLTPRRIELINGRHSLILESASSAPVDTDHESDLKVIDALRLTFGTTGATVNELIEVTGLPRSTVYDVRGRLERANRVRLERRGSGFVIHLLDGEWQHARDPETHDTPKNVPDRCPESTPDSGGVIRTSSDRVRTTSEHDSGRFRVIPGGIPDESGRAAPPYRGAGLGPDPGTSA